MRFRLAAVLSHASRRMRAGVLLAILTAMVSVTLLAPFVGDAQAKTCPLPVGDHQGGPAAGHGGAHDGGHDQGDGPIHDEGDGVGHHGGDDSTTPAADHTAHCPLCLPAGAAFAVPVWLADPVRPRSQWRPSAPSDHFLAPLAAPPPARAPPPIA